MPLSPECRVWGGGDTNGNVVGSPNGVKGGIPSSQNCVFLLEIHFGPIYYKHFFRLRNGNCPLFSFMCHHFRMEPSWLESHKASPGGRFYLVSFIVFERGMFCGKKYFGCNLSLKINETKMSPDLCIWVFLWCSFDVGWMLFYNAYHGFFHRISFRKQNVLFRWLKGVVWTVSFGCILPHVIEQSRSSKSISNIITTSMFSTLWIIQQAEIMMSPDNQQSLKLVLTKTGQSDPGGNTI